MRGDNDVSYNWTAADLLEIEFSEPDSFLKIRETLTRIGVSSKKENILYPSCHILHKRGKYYIVHFKELFALEGKVADISLDDIARRNTIAKLLEQWGLCTVLMKPNSPETNLSNIKIISHKEKSSWIIKPKYQMRADRARAE